MPIKVSDLAAKTRPLTVDLGDGDKLQIVYRPHSVSLADNQALQEAQGTLGAQPAVAARLCKLLAEWDLVDGDGEPWPITQGGLLALPDVLLADILAAIQEDQSPNARNGRR